MMLPVSSSPISASDSDDASVARRLVLAGNNAEVNRFAFFQYDEPTETTPIHTKTRARELQFNPIVNVRAIRPRSYTLRSNISDVSMGSSCCAASPRAPDYQEDLNDTNPDSDDDEFDRFYKTMPSMDVLNIGDRRRSSVDDFSLKLISHMGYVHSQESIPESFDASSNEHSNRPRSISCDDFFFRQHNLA
jgi:hypothetical protein